VKDFLPGRSGRS